jgi:hypothetical protein
VPALPRLAMIALGFALYPPSPAELGLLVLVALFWGSLELLRATRP